MSEETDWNDFLRVALFDREIDHLKKALAHGADPNASVESDGSTPLYWAANLGLIDAAVALLNAGARVACEANAESTSLHTAAENNDLPMVELLLNADGAAALNWFDYISRTPLMCAVENNNLEIARRLIAAEADVNANDKQRAGNTALHVAAEHCLFEMAELLVRAGADPNIPGWMWLTPLHKAQQRKKPEGQKLAALLEKAAKRDNTS